MKRLAMLTAAAFALTVGLAAQTGEAHASMQQCTGDHELTIGEDGNQSCGTELLVVSGLNGNGEAVTGTMEIEDGAELLPEGTVIEVEIDFDSVVASLDPADARAVYLAAVNEGGLDPAAASSATDSANIADVAAVLTEAEMSVAANYLSASFQNRGTGRSDPAGPNTTRGQATEQGFLRGIANWFRNPSIPGVNFRHHGRTREYYPNGQLKKETGAVTELEVG
ncbi:hypothetical protein [Brevundimonas sp.]|uniref:hypothetical protein n=1 Tax=Brevundimonas sp. TaxID=1871086 RepID=UPI003F70EA08